MRDKTVFYLKLRLTISKFIYMRVECTVGSSPSNRFAIRFPEAIVIVLQWGKCLSKLQLSTNHRPAQWKIQVTVKIVQLWLSGWAVILEKSSRVGFFLRFTCIFGRDSSRLTAIGYLADGRERKLFKLFVTAHRYFEIRKCVLKTRKHVLKLCNDY